MTDVKESSTQGFRNLSERGIARILKQYCARITDEDVSVVEKNGTENEEENKKHDIDVEDEQARKKLCRENLKNKRKGQNKSRPCPFKLSPEDSLCPVLIDTREDSPWPECNRGKGCNCRHDVTQYMKDKPSDIVPVCHVYSTYGYCRRGLSCRFGSQHLTEDGKNLINNEIYKTEQDNHGTINMLSKNVQISLRKHKYDFNKSTEVVNSVDRLLKNSISCRGDNNNENLNVSITEKEEIHIGPALDEGIITIRKEEKKCINWSNELYLAPLTTVGNLPFRRICKEFGADITCSEMAMATSLLQGDQNEWALVKRHESEKIFGVQICGNNPQVMTRCAQLLDEQTNIDFVDINLGCPIDFVYNQGAGSGLLRRENILKKIMMSMSAVLSVPLTVKSRTGVYTNKNVLHNLAPHFSDWGASFLSIHGRSREQRYTKKADWSYVEECAKLASPLPVFGGGDILSFEDYEQVRAEYPAIRGFMLGRGPLIKPWLFTEIKERRHWDISSKERLEILQKYVNYGLEHWGSDTRGVENTRRFLLEWLSFLHRYIPVGLLEYPPQKMNERPPPYRGRDDLETIMASPNCSDWIKISEMLLGPVPHDYKFLPKHKANSWN